MMVMVMEVLIAHYLLIPISLAGYKVPEKRRGLIKAKQEQIQSGARMQVAGLSGQSSFPQ